MFLDSWMNIMWEKCQDFDGQFEKATALVGSELVNRVDGMVNRWLPALEIVRKAFNKRHEVHSSGKIVKFEKGEILGWNLICCV